MNSLQDIMELHGEAYIKSRKLPPNIIKALYSIKSCRTAELAGHVYECDECGEIKISYNSCRNRHCPKCQTYAKEMWIYERSKSFLPTHYFHIVFTIPEELNSLTLFNQKEIYSILFRATSEKLLELAKDKKYLNELYFLRLGVESKYKGLKSSLKIEEFSGTKPIAIEQDFYALIYLSMVGALIKNDADTAIANDNKGKTLNSTYQSNRKFILGQVFKRIVHLLVKSKSRNKILDLILEKAIKIRSQVRYNRSCERKKKPPRKKHHHNIKSCI